MSATTSRASDVPDSGAMESTLHRPTRGVWCQLPDVGVARTLATAGFDWSILDAQHGLFDRAAVVEVGRALTDAGAAFGVRVPSLDFAWIGAALDAGATTIIVPQVHTADQARVAVDATFYPPIGGRSHGQLAVLWGGKAVTPAAANDQITCAVMIESAQALSNVDEIAAVPGLGMLFVGPFDLSLSLGIDTADVAADGGPLSLIRTVATRNNLTLGAFAGTVDRAEIFRAAGVEFLVVATDLEVLRTGAASVLAAPL